VAAITVKGFVRQSTLEAIATRLHATLTAQGRNCSDTPEFRYYNSPWQLFGRRSDVLFTLNDMPTP
jgi:alkyl sulfatase BDS1-like metallo-beta-lactamase superfamily hydrolase